MIYLIIMLLRTLRIGNIIRLDGDLKNYIGLSSYKQLRIDPMTIVRLDYNLMNYLFSRSNEAVDNPTIPASSIKINEAILLHCGFDKLENCSKFQSATVVFVCKGIYIYFDEGRFGKKFKVHIGDHLRDRDMEYLHHLQNTYYWTIWQELQIDIQFIRDNFCSLNNY